MPLEGNSLEKLNANNDHGFWFEQNLSGKLSHHWSFLLHTEQHWGVNYTRFYNQINDLVLLQDATRFLNLCSDSIVKEFLIGGGYDLTDRIQKNTRGKFHWVLVRRSIVEAHLSLQLLGFTIKQRLRREYENFVRKHYINYSLVRYRVIINSPWKFTRWNINPYVMDEIFVRRDTFNKNAQKGLIGGLYNNRFRIGVNIDLTDKLSSAIYWQWRIRKHKPGTHPRWFNIYDIGLVFNVAL
jgi:hypothetical protein